MADPKPFQAHDRVRAPFGVYYAVEDLQIDAGTEGEVVETTHGGFLAHVRWDGREASIATSFDALELVFRAPLLRGAEVGGTTPQETPAISEKHPKNPEGSMETPMRDLGAIAAEVLTCAEAWEPEVRVLGNVRADELAHLARFAAAAAREVRVSVEIELDHDVEPEALRRAVRRALDTTEADRG